MFRVKGSTIILKQGDTLKLKVNLMRKTAEGIQTFVPEDGSRLRFIAKKRLGEKHPVVIESEINLQTMYLRIESEQTKDLQLRGRECELTYDLEFTRPSGDVETILSNAKLIIVPEVD